MDQDTPTTVTEEDLANMTDEQIDQLDPSAFEPPETFEENEDETGEGESSEETQDDEHEKSEEDDANEADSDSTEDESAESDDSADEDTDGLEDEDVEDDDSEEESDQTDDDGVDYKAEYEKILQPFKANGKEIKVDSVDDAIQLMQMGANYTKKMAALKPNLKLLKMLENNKLLDEEKLGFYIDLENKDPEAIKKLIKDSDLDTWDMNLEEESDYKPGKHTVDDQQVELDMVLDELKDTPTYTKTLDTVSNKWDRGSKQAIYENPDLLKVINDHMQSGVYGVISKEMEREEVLGRLNGMTHLEAYQKIGDSIQERGGFDHLFADKTKAPVKRKVAKPKGKQEDPKVKAKRRAASTTRTSAEKKTAEDYNPLALSDEAFEEMINSEYM